MGRQLSQAVRPRAVSLPGRAELGGGDWSAAKRLNMEPRDETQLGSPLGCDTFKMADDESRRRHEMSSLQQQVRRRFMITDILSSAAAAAVVDRSRRDGDDNDDDSGQDVKPATAALDMRLLFPHLPLSSGGGGGGRLLAERTDIETDTDNEGEEDGETDHEKGSICTNIGLSVITLFHSHHVFIERTYGTS